jgi:hypothetical protein
MQARGVINRDINSPTPTNAATVEFDLPAYVGGSAQKTFFATPILNSYMTVNLVQADNGTPALPVGSSMLYSLQQCKLGAPATAAGGGGTAGIVIPGLEGITPGKQGSANDIAVNVSETIHAADSPVLAPGVFIGISETIHTSDQVALKPQVSVVVNEKVHVTDGSPALLTGPYISVTETIHTTDKPQSSVH